MKNENTTCQAVYQVGIAIYGIGKTNSEAIADAKQWVDDPDNLESDLDKGKSNNYGDMIIITISKAVEDKADEEGGEIEIVRGRDGVYRLPEEGTVKSSSAN